ncbi:hypothetical protein KUF71_001718 [Frankliniella fusca]|uniref:Serine/arginine repetitive matrix protein 2-like n=1 Tax=Frankliniella fusca TaxID=407009 RepID=A0AAE1LLK6_9NEOP|nr:hypothetical protein KUF71_001718 [Frankliniella fusca]
MQHCSSSTPCSCLLTCLLADTSLVASSAPASASCRRERRGRGGGGAAAAASRPASRRPGPGAGGGEQLRRQRHSQTATTPLAPFLPEARHVVYPGHMQVPGPAPAPTRTKSSSGSGKAITAAPRARAQAPTAAPVTASRSARPTVPSHRVSVRVRGRGASGSGPEPLPAQTPAQAVGRGPRPPQRPPDLGAGPAGARGASRARASRLLGSVSSGVLSKGVQQARAGASRTSLNPSRAATAPAGRRASTPLPSATGALRTRPLPRVASLASAASRTAAATAAAPGRARVRGASPAPRQRRRARHRPSRGPSRASLPPQPSRSRTTQLSSSSLQPCYSKNTQSRASLQLQPSRSGTKRASRAALKPQPQSRTKNTKNGSAAGAQAARSRATNSSRASLQPPRTRPRPRPSSQLQRTSSKRAVASQTALTTPIRSSRLPFSSVSLRPRRSRKTSSLRDARPVPVVAAAMRVPRARGARARALRGAAACSDEMRSYWDATAEASSRRRSRCQRAAGRLRAHRGLMPASGLAAGRRSDRTQGPDRPPTRRVVPGGGTGGGAAGGGGAVAVRTTLTPPPAQRGPSAAMLQLQVAQQLLRPECIRQMSDRCLAQLMQLPPSKKPSPMKRDSSAFSTVTAEDRVGAPLAPVAAAAAPVSTARWYGPTTPKRRQGLPAPDQEEPPVRALAPTPSADRPRPPELEPPHASSRPSKSRPHSSGGRVARRRSGPALRLRPDLGDAAADAGSSKLPPRPCRRVRPPKGAVVPGAKAQPQPRGARAREGTRPRHAGPARPVLPGRSNQVPPPPKSSPPLRRGAPAPASAVPPVRGRGSATASASRGVSSKASVRVDQVQCGAREQGCPPRMERAVPHKSTLTAVKKTPNVTCTGGIAPRPRSGSKHGLAHSSSGVPKRDRKRHDLREQRDPRRVQDTVKRRSKESLRMSLTKRRCR